MTLTDKVTEALKNAEENDYNFDGKSPGEIATDLMTYCADLEGENFYEVSQVVFMIRD